MTHDPRDMFAPLRSFDELMALVRTQCGIDDLFVLAHDMRSLRPVQGHFESIDDDELIDSLLACQVTAHDGHHFVPLPAQQFPFLVGRLDEPNPQVGASWAGLLALHGRSLFEQLERLRRRVAMTVEAQLQWDQLNLRAAAVADLNIGATLEPASTVAGDMYDIAVSPEGRPSILSMDAMGHGVTATLSAALALSAIRNARRFGASLVEQVQAADEAMLAEYAGERFVTMVAVEFADDHIAVVNAGHEPIRRGTPSQIETLNLAADPPLGLDGQTSYTVHRIDRLAPGESLCLLSDGAPESRDLEYRMLGETGINEIIESELSPSGLQSAHRIGRAVLKYCTTLDDDLTVVVATRSQGS